MMVRLIAFTLLVSCSSLSDGKNPGPEFRSLDCCNPKPGPEPRPPSSPDLDPDSDPFAYLDAHNGYRKSKGIPPLVWDNELEEIARKWGTVLAGEGCRLRHSSNRLGENIAGSSGKKWSPREPVRWWYNEYRWYDYSTNKCQQGKTCGHYTQVMWRKSQRLGCATVYCPGSGNKAVYVCNYDPPGNYVGQKPW